MERKKKHTPLTPKGSADSRVLAWSAEHPRFRADFVNFVGPLKAQPSFGPGLFFWTSPASTPGVRDIPVKVIGTKGRDSTVSLSRHLAVLFVTLNFVTLFGRAVVRDMGSGGGLTGCRPDGRVR